MSSRRWSARVTRESDAMDLESGVFKLNNPMAIAKSLKRSATRSSRLKSSPFRSAMSMLNFYINRAGKNLSKSRLKILNDAKDALREVFNRNITRNRNSRRNITRNRNSRRNTTHKRNSRRNTTRKRNSIRNRRL